MATIPIVFATGSDPIRAASSRQPESSWRQHHGSSLSLLIEMEPKRLELLRQLRLNADGDPRPSSSTQVNLRQAGAQGVDIQAAARERRARDHDPERRQVYSGDRCGLCDAGPNARLSLPSLVAADPLFFTRVTQLSSVLSARHAILDAVLSALVRPAAGRAHELWLTRSGLLSSARCPNAARILKGEKPAEDPVKRTTKVELLINLKPPRRSASPFHMLLARADEVIE